MMSDAEREARELDARFLTIVADWTRGGAGCDEVTFDALARDELAYQLAKNEPYARFAARCGVTLERLPASWREIPAVPSAAFKEATLATFDIRRAECEFHTSGSTAETSGKHYLARAALYDAALLAGFERFMLADGARLRYLLLVPNPRNRRHSSLGYMMGHVAVLRGDGRTAYFLDDERVDADGFGAALREAIDERAPVCIAATAFALVSLLEALEAAGTRFAAPPTSRIMETGGFKGRARAVERGELYARLERSLGIPQHAIVAEYGMTELVSQYYDSPESRSSPVRVKVAPPWLRTLVVDEAGREVAPGEAGFLRHVDLGNRSSVVAIQTEDRGYAGDGGIVSLGRELDAPPRGCSLDAEALVARR